MTAGRTNQKARTRAAILEAAVAILREGREPTVPEAADRARVSTATAYRYFTSAEDLQDEAATEMVTFVTSYEDIGRAIAAAGDDVHERMDALVRTLGHRMLTDQAPFRQQAKAGHDRWFAHQHQDVDGVEVREGRRNHFIQLVLEPLDGRLEPAAHQRLAAALAVGFGTEAVTSLTDVVRLAPEAALEVMSATCRWILDGALAETAS